MFRLVGNVKLVFSLNTGYTTPRFEVGPSFTSRSDGNYLSCTSDIADASNLVRYLI